MLKTNTQESASMISGRRSKKSAAGSHRSKLDKTIILEFQQQMQELEQAMSKELRIKTRKLNKMQRELIETQDYFRELVFLIEEVLHGKNPFENST